jgi:HEAT repeat protein
MSEFDFQPYLSAIALHYAKDDRFYTPTDALLLLEVQTVVEREEKADQEKRVEQFPVLEGLRKYAIGDGREHVLLAGRPGSGKSTALRQLVVALAAAPQPPILGEHELNNTVQSPQNWGFGGHIPVLVQLKADRTVPELIKAEFRRAKVAVTEPQIDEWLMHDRLVLLLDGVNEIPNDDLRRELARFREENLTVPMIFTTRDLSLGGDLGIGKRFEMKPLSERQMREFVGKRLGEKGAQLLGQLRDRLREIAETPLLLKMLCDLFEQTGEVPQNKGELFRRFDGEYERFKGLPAVSADFRRFKAEVLQRLAFVMMQGDGRTEFWLTIERTQAEKAIEQWLTGRVSDPGVRAKEWLEDLLEHHLLQVAAEVGKVEFHHQLFQEYYAAEALLGMFRDRDSAVCDRERFQEDYLNYLKWTEVVAIGLSLMEDEKDAVDVVKWALDVDLMLGARLAGAVRSDVQEKSINYLNNQKLHNQQQVPTWLNIELLGQTKSELAVSKLLLYFNHIDSEIRRNLANALGNIALGKAINLLIRLLEDPDSDVRNRAAYDLGRIGNEVAAPQLIQAALQEIEIDEEVFETITDSLGKIRSEGIISILITLLQSPHLNERITAASGLGKTGSKQAIPLLTGLLEDHSLKMRRTAIFALGQIGSKDSAIALVKALQDPDLMVRCDVAMSLGLVGCLDEFSHVSNFIQNRDECIDWAKKVLAGTVALSIDSSETGISEQISQYGNPSSAKESMENLPAYLLPHFVTRLPTSSGQTILRTIQKIQSNCKFYNYEIHQKAQTRQPPVEQQPAQEITNNYYRDYIANGDKIEGDKIIGNKYENPNATEVKIFENVQNYHESPPRDPPP